MAITRRAEITIEKHSLTVIRNSNRSNLFLCVTCGGNRYGLTTADVSDGMNIEPRVVFEFLGNGRLHALKTSNRVLLICESSVETNRAVPRQPRALEKEK